MSPMDTWTSFYLVYDRTRTFKLPAIIAGMAVYIYKQSPRVATGVYMYISEQY